MPETTNAPEIDDLYDEDGEPNLCPGCELVAIRAAVSEARERWANIFQMSKDTEDRTVREALATALHYVEIACDHGRARHENAPGGSSVKTAGYAVGYCPDKRPSPAYRSQGLCCEYEHCIETMGFPGTKEPTLMENGEFGWPEGESPNEIIRRDGRHPLSCPIFGHDCPGGVDRVRACREGPDGSVVTRAGWGADIRMRTRAREELKPGVKV